LGIETGGNLFRAGAVEVGSGQDISRGNGIPRVGLRGAAEIFIIGACAGMAENACA